MYFMVTFGELPDLCLLVWILEPGDK
jgi:hypothetical protein